LRILFTDKSFSGKSFFEDNKSICWLFLFILLCWKNHGFLDFFPAFSFPLLIWDASMDLEAIPHMVVLVSLLLYFACIFLGGLGCCGCMFTFPCIACVGGCGAGYLYGCISTRFNAVYYVIIYLLCTYLASLLLVCFSSL